MSGETPVLKTIMELPLPRIPNVPNEVIWHLLKFFSADDLLKLRFLSRNWNEQISSSKRIQSLIQLSTESELNEFVATMDSRIQDSIPFGSYEFNCKIELIHPFIANLGLNIRTCILKLTESPTVPLEEILSQLPNLECLRILGSEIKVDWIKLPSRKLHKLRSLTINQANEEYDSAETVTLAIIHSWIGQNFLYYFECGFPLHLDSQQEFQKFLTSLHSFQTIALKVRFSEGTSSKKSVPFNHTHKMPNLRLCIENGENDGGVVSRHLQNLSNYLTQLRIFVPITDIQISPMPRLEGIILDVTGSTTPDAHPFLPLHFPSLRRVTIHYINSIPEISINFRHTVFNSVDTLYLQGAFDRVGQGFESWHTIFPNVKNLRIAEDAICKMHLDYVTSHFPGITHFNITSVDDSQIASALFHPNGIQWALSGLNELQKLEFVGYDAEMLKGISCLTKSKNIQPFNVLGFYSEWSRDEAVLGKLLFQNSNWHKKVIFGRNYPGSVWTE